MRGAFRPVLLTLFSVGLAACSIRDAACGKPIDPQKAAMTEQANAIQNGGSNEPFVIAFLGDSLTEGLGLLANEAYPQLVENKFRAEGYSNVEIMNAGISGDTTAGGLRRIEGVLQSDVKVLVVALGGNDALRGLSPEQTKDNLTKIVAAALDKGVMILLAGMEAPPNLGEDYQLGFRAAFLQVARMSKDMKYMPFLLEGVAGKPELNQADGIHPNTQGAAIIATNMFPILRVLVDTIGGGG